MTNREAVAAKIEPYSLSEDGLEVVFLDASAHFGTNAGIDSTYTSEMMKTVSLAAMYALARLRVLQNEHVDVISNSYDTAKINKAIEAIAASAGLSASLVGIESDSDALTAAKCW